MLESRAFHILDGTKTIAHHFKIINRMHDNESLDDTTRSYLLKIHLLTLSNEKWKYY